MWTCPYEVVKGTQDSNGYGIPAPICTTRLGPQKVLARIDEVYRKWKAGERTVPQPVGMLVGA